MEEAIKWLGHASVRIEGEKIIYIDPWKLRKVIPKADLILITHDHYDHCSPEDVQKIRKENTVIVAAENCRGKLSGGINFVNPGDKLRFWDISIEAVPAYNPAKQFHPRSYNGVGYILEIQGTRIYHAGDTDFIPEMEKFKVDIALLPIGGTYTMDVEEAVKAIKALNPRLVIPIHYGTIVGNIQDAEKLKEKCPDKVKILPPIE